MDYASQIIYSQMATEEPRISPFEIEVTSPGTAYTRVVVSCDECPELPEFDPWANIDFEEVARQAFGT